MPTGDISNNIRKMRSKLKEIKYNEDCDVSVLAEGLPTAYLPIYHFAFTSYSPAISQLILDKGIELYGKSDARFMEAVYKILRDVFAYKPPITKEQFFGKGFAERKVIMCAEILEMVKDKNNELNPGRSKTTLKTSVRPKSAVETKTLPLTHGAPKTKRPDSSRLSPRNTESVTIGAQVVNELVTAPATEPLRHVSTSLTHSIPVRHTASRDGSNTSKSSDHSESLPLKPPSILSQHAALLRPENHPVKHVSIQSPRDVRIISPEGPAHITSRLTSIENVSVQSTPNRTWGYEADTQENFKAARSIYMTPSIKKVCPQSVEVVTIPRSDIDEEPSIVEVQAATSDSVLQAPVPFSHTDLTTLTQNVEILKQQVQDLAEMSRGGNSVEDKKLNEVLSKMENLTARILLLENRVSIIEAKFGDVQPAYSSGIATVPAGSQTTALSEKQGSHSLDLSHNSPALFTGPGNSFAEELRSMGSSQRAQSIKDSADFSLNYSPIRKVNGVVGSVMSANEETFALEVEDDARRASTPTMGGTISCDTSLQCNFSHVETKDVVSRINNMIKETTQMMREKPGHLDAPHIDISQ